MQFSTLKLPRGIQLDYHLSLPQAPLESKPDKLMLAIPPGSQNHQEAAVYKIWLGAFQEAGWTTIIPVAPNEKLFFQGNERLIPPLLKHIEMQLGFKQARFGLLGISNGGISAFRIATLNAESFTKMIVIPGWPKPADAARLEKLQEIATHIIVGAEDSHWLVKGQEFAEKINTSGGQASLEIVQDEGHRVFASVEATHLLKILSD
jgi:predicted esterase